jgi:hypothetical protein
MLVHYDGARRNGEVRERLNRAVSKTVEPLRVPWVRIPPSPPIDFLVLHHTGHPRIHTLLKAQALKITRVLG